MTVGSVALAVLPGMPVYELGLACEVFGVPRPDLADPWYAFRVCAVSTSTAVETGFAVHADAGFDGLVGAGTVVVPAVPYVHLETERPFPPALLDGIARAAAGGARIVSLCSGAFVLAAAGLLDGRRATTHWMQADLLAKRHPRVEVDPAVLYVDDGDVLTSAGRSAGLDLCLHIVRRDLGAAVANQLARRMVVAPHRSGGQAQFIEFSVPVSEHHGLGPVLEWASASLDRPLTVREWARRARMSERTFARRFHETTGSTPLRWLLQQRLGRAQLLLETTDLPIDRVAERCGLGSAANLRRHFGLHVGTSPSEYRRTFR